MRLPWPVARPLQAYGLVLGTVSASVAFGGGCGGGGEPLSASEYRKQANALCAEQAGVVASVPRPEPDDFARWVETANDRLHRWPEATTTSNHRLSSDRFTIVGWPRCEAAGRTPIA